MDGSTDAPGAPVPLESVLCTKELELRPSRPPDHEGEVKALLALAQELTNSPGNVLRRLVDTVLELCHGHSAGISLLEEAGPPGGLSPGGDHFRWYAVAGEWAPLVWATTTARDYGPCGTVLDRNTTLLMSKVHLHFTQFASVHPLMVEALLVPFHVNGKAVGTVWVVAHDESRKFDAEDQRLLESLATFAATAYQARLSIAALAKANQHLQAEIAERQRAEEALHAAGRRKNEFLAMLAHELRNPLAPIRNAVQLLRLTPCAEETRETAVDMMDRHVGQVVRLVDDLLDISRISLEKIELRKEPLDLAALVNNAVEAARPLCESMGHELTLTVPAKPMCLNADPTRLTQVFGNLLSNACKFTERGGRIHLTVEQEGRRALIRVRDTGIGIAAEELPRIFEMFSQIDSSLGRSRDGLGIGLTLVKSLVEMHEGTVEAKSAGLDRGSEFVVSLPVAAVPLQRLAPQPSGIKHSEAVPRRILVVDDHRDAAESLAMLLRLSGHDVHTTHDGLDAVDAAAVLQPDLILLDIGLPGLDGYEAARRIRAQQSEGLVLVALTGWGQEEDRRRSEEAGFDAHLVKPVSLAALSNLLIESGPG